MWPTARDSTEPTERPVDDRRSREGRTVPRRGFLRAAGAASTASLLAGCGGDGGDGGDGSTTDEDESSDRDRNRDTILITALLPTISVKVATEAGEEARWIPHSVLDGTAGGSWELALQMGAVYDPATDLGGSGEGYDPPGWVPNGPVDDDFTYFRVPSRFMMSVSSGVEPRDYPINPELAGGGQLLLNFHEFDPEPGDDSTYEFSTVLKADPFGQNRSDSVGPFRMDLNFREQSRFFDEVSNLPGWDAGGQRISARSPGFAATDATSEQNARSMGFAWRQLVKLQFDTFVNVATASPFTGTLLRELGEEVLMTVTVQEAVKPTVFAAVSELATPDRGYSTPSDLQGVDGEELSSYAVTGSLFVPPHTPEMATKVNSSDARSGYDDLTVVDVGLGLAGPMVYASHDRTESTTEGPGGTTPTERTVSLDPRATFLRTFRDDPEPPAILALSELGLSPGDRVRLEQYGEYDIGNGNTRRQTIGVFSASDRVLGPEEHPRVPDAVDAGPDFETWDTYAGYKTTDIPEDFRVDTRVEVTVPDGARYLLLGAHDDLYQDNDDPDEDYRVRVVPLRGE